ncbi:MAG: HEAT repeat domain-containing protein [Syntrophobacteraceae bacterium]
MKLKAFVVGISLGMMVFSIIILVKEPPFGRQNLGAVGSLLRNASLIMMLVSCLMIGLFAVKVRIAAIIGIILMIASLTVSYSISEYTGYSMGTSGWISMFLSMFVIFPVGLILCFMTGLFSLLHIIEKDQSAKRQALIAFGIVLLLGIAHQVIIAIKPDVRGLVASLRNEDNNYKRFSIADRISEIEDKEKVDLIIELLKDTNPRVREAAAVSLGGRQRGANGKALRPLLEALNEETDQQAKEWMVRRLATITPAEDNADKDRTIDALIEILKNDQSSLRGVAAEGLGLIKDKKAIEPLLEALDVEPFYALNALIEITGERNQEVWKKWSKEKRL